MVQEMMSSITTLSLLLPQLKLPLTINLPLILIVDHTKVQSPSRSKPRREIKRPKYLDDYVLQ